MNKIESNSSLLINSGSKSLLINSGSKSSLKKHSSIYSINNHQNLLNHQNSSNNLKKNVINDIDIDRIKSIQKYRSQKNLNQIAANN